MVSIRDFLIGRRKQHTAILFFVNEPNKRQLAWLIEKLFIAKEKFTSAVVLFRVSSGESECIKIFGADIVHSLEDAFLKPFSFSQKK